MNQEEKMKLIIQASNVHQGGGRQLLLALMQSLDIPTVIFLDSRFSPVPEMPDFVEIYPVKPTVGKRLKAEFKLRTLSENEDILLCFGNLPPIFSVRGKVLLFLQNRFLSEFRPLNSFSWKIRCRVFLERIWLKTCLRKGRIIVQTESMAKEVKKAYLQDCHVLPFVGKSDNPINAGQKENIKADKVRYDFLYVASGEPHKNHHNLIETWKELASRQLYPSLCLTLDVQNDSALVEWIIKEKERYSLNIDFQVESPDKMHALYSCSEALLYPSLLESYGLPLIEAFQAGLPILASERDFVRDVVIPIESFDPESPLSIARAVMRYLGEDYEVKKPLAPREFIRSIMNTDI